MASEKLQNILLEVDPSSKVDNGAVLACIDYIIQNNLLRTSRLRQSKPKLGIVATDEPPERYRQICKRCFATTECLIDGYSQWYALRNMPKRSAKEGIEKIHISDVELDEGYIERLVTRLRSKSNNVGIGESPDDRETVIVIDSLSSISRFVDNPLAWVMLLLQQICVQGCSLIVTIRTNETIDYESTLKALRDMMDIHLKLSQIRKDDGHGNERNDRIRMLVCRRRFSGRVILGSISGLYDDQLQQIGSVDIKTIDSAIELKSHDAYDGKRNGGSDIGSGENDDRQVDLEEQLSQHGLTFRVSLSSKEREMRANVSLPYVHQDESVADRALELHPKHLQIGADGRVEGEEGEDGEVWEDDDLDEDDEDVFSEDV